MLIKCEFVVIKSSDFHFWEQLSFLCSWQLDSHWYFSPSLSSHINTYMTSFSCLLCRDFTFPAWMNTNNAAVCVTHGNHNTPVADPHVCSWCLSPARLHIWPRGTGEESNLHTVKLDKHESCVRLQACSSASVFMHQLLPVTKGDGHMFQQYIELKMIYDSSYCFFRDAEICKHLVLFRFYRETTEIINKLWNYYKIVLLSPN